MVCDTIKLPNLCQGQKTFPFFAFLRLSSCQSGISLQHGQTFILLLFSFSPQIYFPQVVYLSTLFPFLPNIFTALLRGDKLKLTTLGITAINFEQKGCFYVSLSWQPSHICVPSHSRISLTYQVCVWFHSLSIYLNMNIWITNSQSIIILF